MTQAEIMAYAMNLLSEHRLYAWSFKFDNHKRRFGVCNYREQYIGVSWAVAQLNKDADIIDTIRHEIAHALTPGADHTRRWKLAAMACGARPETCAAKHVIQVPGRWQYPCPCGVTYNRYKRPTTRPGAKYVCPSCRRVITWTDTQATQATPSPSMGELYAALSA